MLALNLAGMNEFNLVLSDNHLKFLSVFLLMQQRDIIKDEIERLGRVLGKLVAMLLELESGGASPQMAREVAEDKFRNELELDLDELLELNLSNLKAKLDELHFQPPHVDQLGDFLSALAHREENPELRERFFRRALMLYDLAGERSGTYSMARSDKESAIRAELL